MEASSRQGQSAPGWQAEARRVAAGIRKRVLEVAIAQGGGYLSQACSSAEILATLYVRVMRLGPSSAPMVPPPFAGAPGPGSDRHAAGALYNGPRHPDLDRFFLSPAHYTLALYAALIETGRMSPSALDQMGRDGSSVEMIGAEHSPGMEVMAGSLGQTMSQAAGVAWARKRRGETGRVWIFLSDGELQIGQTWEAIAAMGFHGLDNVGIYIDANGYQCDGRVEEVMTIEPIDGRLESFGAAVFTVGGHDVEALAAPADCPTSGRPLVVIARTDPCAGMPLLRANAPKLHYIRFRSAEEIARCRAAMEELSCCTKEG